MKTPVVLLDDPAANDAYDLEAILGGWPHGIAGIITPLGAAAPGGDGSAPPTQSGSAGAEGSPSAGASDSATTLGLKRARIRYRLRGKVARELEAATGPPIIRALGESLLVVGFVSAATFPLLVALAQHAETRDFLRVGITSSRLDTSSYNLARKLIVDGVISYHEHTRALAKLLCPRLELMRAAHVERLRSSPSP